MNLLEFHQLFSKNNISPTATLALDFADMMEPSFHGLLGQVVTSSRNLEQAIQVFIKYKPTRNQLFNYSWKAQGDIGWLFFEPKFDLGKYKMLNLVSILWTTFKVIEFILGKKRAKNIAICYSDDFSAKHLFEGKFNLDAQIVKDRQGVGLIIPTSLLTQVNPMADEKQFSITCQLLNEELRILKGRYTEKVKNFLIKDRNSRISLETKCEWHSLQQIADLLFVSRSTLIRKLKNEGSQYSQILDETRSDLACWYLRETAISIADIAYIIGYRDSSNFNKTFKKWKKETPVKYRKTGGLDE